MLLMCVVQNIHTGESEPQTIAQILIGRMRHPPPPQVKREEGAGEGGLEGESELGLIIGEFDLTNG